VTADDASDFKRDESIPDPIWPCIPLFTLKVPLIGAVFADTVLERSLGTGDTALSS